MQCRNHAKLAQEALNRQNLAFVRLWLKVRFALPLTHSWLARPTGRSGLSQAGRRWPCPCFNTASAGQIG